LNRFGKLPVTNIPRSRPDFQTHPQRSRAISVFLQSRTQLPTRRSRALRNLTVINISGRRHTKNSKVGRARTRSRSIDLLVQCAGLGTFSTRPTEKPVSATGCEGGARPAVWFATRRRRELN
jgi:hypothetical protein